ncbi:hypothetical protein AeNC1_007814 [Aphanomyces euteiches]|nr:hypothetical protein AeNC1_007814 [Aphanomyces euteiches]
MRSRGLKRCLMLSVTCFFLGMTMVMAVDALKRSSKTAQVWVYDDAQNPWDGKLVEVQNADDILRRIHDFLDTATSMVRGGAVDSTVLANLETELYEHFFDLSDLAQSSTASKITNQIFELNSSLQDLLDLLVAERKATSQTSSTDSSEIPLSDAFLDVYDELLENGHSTSTFTKWVDMAASENARGAAYETIGMYSLFQPNAVAFPLDLDAALAYLKKAGTTQAKVLDAILRLALYRDESHDNVLRASTSTNFLARVALAHRIYSNATASVLSDPCEEALVYYYTSAEESVADMISVGGEKDIYEPMVRLSDVWSGKVSASSDDLLVEPTHGVDALDYVRALAFGGNPEALHRLGEMHFFGDAQAGLPPNHQEAVRHFEQAAAGGVVHSLANLGLMYANGIGVQADPQRAVQYFQEAADRGSAFAVNGLGFMFWTGQGVEKNATAAVEHFEKAVAMGFADAHQYLGAAYLNGEGVARNESLAFYHFSVAVNQSNSLQAWFNLGIMYYRGLGTPRSCPQSLEAFREVTWRSAAFDDFLLSQRLGFESYTRGDYQRALVHSLVWSALGLPQAGCNAGFLLEQGQADAFTTKIAPLALAKDLYSTHISDAEALRKLGHCHRDGWPQACPRNETAALEYYERAGQLADSESLYSAGWLYSAQGDWGRAHDAWTACQALNYPDNIPCMFPALLLDVWAWYRALLVHWSVFIV